MNFAEELCIVQPAEISVVALLQELVRWRPRPPTRRNSLLGQMLVRLAELLDRAVVRAHAQSVVDPTHSVAVREFDWEKATTEEAAVELSKYRQAQTKMLSGHLRHMALATDKSRVLGMSLLSTAVTLPTNQACWLFPVVPRGCTSI